MRVCVRALRIVSPDKTLRFINTIIIVIIIIIIMSGISLPSDFVGEGHCSIPCINNQGEHRGQGDNPDPTDATSELLPLRPAFRCYTLDSDKTLTAWFGYDNRNPYNVYVAAGPENRVGGEVEEITTLAGSGEVTTKFSSGVVPYAMSLRSVTCCLKSHTHRGLKTTPILI